MTDEEIKDSTGEPCEDAPHLDPSAPFIFNNRPRYTLTELREAATDARHETLVHFILFAIFVVGSISAVICFNTLVGAAVDEMFVLLGVDE